MPPVIVFAPNVPRRVRRSLQRHPEHWRRGTEPPPPLDLRANAPVILENLGLRLYQAGLFVLSFGGTAFCTVFTVLGVLSTVVPITWSQLWWWTGSATAATATAVVSLLVSQISPFLDIYPPTPYHRGERRARRYHGRYVAADLLDTKSADFLRRAQRAGTDIMESPAARARLGRSFLGEEIWRLAQDLEHQAVLLAEYNAFGSRPLDPDENAARARLQKALSKARRATTAKVTALEACARSIRSLDGAAPRKASAAALSSLRRSLKDAENLSR